LNFQGSLFSGGIKYTGYHPLR